MYRVPACRTITPRHLYELKFPNKTGRPLQEYVNEFHLLLSRSLSVKSGFSFIRLGDGEAYFLQGRAIGNIPKRHLITKDIGELDLNRWKTNLLLNDVLMYDISWSLRKLWTPVTGITKHSDYFPLVAIYISLATRELFRSLDGESVGIIGPSSKLKLVRKLLTYPAYREYLSFNGFDQYIEVPQKGACDNVEKVLDSISSQIGGNVCRAYLVGTGIAKLFLLSQLKRRHPAVYVDIGGGLDALGSIISREKPYFADWVNFRLKAYDYSGLDILWKTKTMKTNGFIQYLDQAGP